MEKPFYVSELFDTVPTHFSNKTQRKIYDTLQQLHIPFLRVETDDGSTMENCVAISKGLDCDVVKTLFLCNRQQTRHYLYVTNADKPFVTKDFCNALGIPRVSFAPEKALWEKLGLQRGATTVLSLILDTANDITLAIDRDILQRPIIACTDGTTTGFMKISTNNLILQYLPHCGHSPIII